MGGTPTAPGARSLGCLVGLLLQTQRLVQTLELAGREIAPQSGRDRLEAEGADADPPKASDGDADGLHDPAHDVVHALVDDDGEDQAVARLAQDAALLGHHPVTLDDDPVADPLQRLLARPRQREDVVLLVELIPRMHHPVGDVAVVGQEQQPLGVAVQPPDGKDTLGHVDEVHDRAPVALIANGGDVAARLVEEKIANRLGSKQLAVDPNLSRARVDLGPKLGDDLAVHRHPPGPNHLLRRAARSRAASRHHTL